MKENEDYPMKPIYDIMNNAIDKLSKNMEREIKFRAWDGEKIHRVMYYKGGKTCVVPLKRFPMQEEIIAENIMQFTGVTDKAGNEIYEGDIVSRGDGNFIVRYKNDKYYIGYVATKDDKCQSYIHIWYDGIEVIGNIYQNKDLIHENKSFCECGQQKNEDSKYCTGCNKFHSI